MPTPAVPNPLSFSEISPDDDISDDDGGYAHTVDDILAADLPRERQPGPQQAAGHDLDAFIDGLPDARDACQHDIDVLVEARLEINRQIKQRRAQLDLLNSAVRMLERVDARLEDD